MKPIVKTILFAVSTAIASASVFAQPNDQYDHHRPDAPPAPMMKHHQPHHDVRPSRDWRAGHRVPDAHFRRAVAVDYRHHKKLPRPGRYQQWYKIHGDYVLMNTRTHHVIRTIRG